MPEEKNKEVLRSRLALLLSDFPSGVKVPDWRAEQIEARTGLSGQHKKEHGCSLFLLEENVTHLR